MNQSENPYSPTGVRLTHPQPVRFDVDAPDVQFETRLTESRFEQIRAVPTAVPLPVTLIGIGTVLFFLIVFIAQRLVHGFDGFGATDLFVLIFLAIYAVSLAFYLVMLWFFRVRASGIENQGTWFRGLIGDLRGQISRTRIYVASQHEGILIPSELVNSMNWYAGALQIRLALDWFFDRPFHRISIPSEAFPDAENTVLSIRGSRWSTLNVLQVDWEHHIRWLIELEGSDPDDAIQFEGELSRGAQDNAARRAESHNRDLTPISGYLTPNSIGILRSPIQGRLPSFLSQHFVGPHMRWSESGIVELVGPDDDAHKAAVVLVPLRCIPERQLKRVSKWFAPLEMS